MTDRNQLGPTEGRPVRAHAECQTCVLGRAAWPNACPFSETRRAELDVLLKQGEPAACVWFIKEGLVALSSRDGSDTELGCSVRGPGSLVGVEALLGRPVPYRAWALTDVVLCATSAEALFGWIGHFDTPMGALLRLGIEETSRRTNEQLSLGGSSIERVARFLLERCVHDEQSRPLDVSQRVMARMLSMTPETLSRTLSKLRQEGAISCTRPVIVSSAEALRRVIERP